MLAVGDLPPDGIQRLTRGERFTCVSGSEEEHEQLHAFCESLTLWLGDLGMDIQQLTPEELRDLLTAHHPGAAPE
jgi:hypothetical protein